MGLNKYINQNITEKPHFILKCIILLYIGLGSQIVHSQAFDFTQYGIEQGIAHEQITDICQDVKGNLWIATQGGGVSKFNGLSFENFTVRDGLLSNYVRKLTTDQEGNVWMATAEGISKFNGNQIEYSSRFEVANGKSVNSILKDTKGDLWYATTEQGVSLIPATGEFHTYNQSNGFVNDRVIDIKEGENGEIWLVTIINGVYKYKDGVFTQVIEISDVKGYILSITVRDDYLLVATNRGVFKYDGQINLLEDFDGMFIKSITPKDDELWLITANSLIQNSDHNNRIFAMDEGFSSKLPTVGFQDREGNMWLGTDGDGIYKFTNSTFVKFDSRHGLSNENVLSIIKDSKGKYWYGTNGGGIFCSEGDVMTNYSTSNGLPNNYITSSAQDKDGNLWFGTRGSGVVKYDGKEFINYTQSGGLVHGNIRKIYCAEDGSVWITTINGLSKWDGTTFENYSVENGLLDNVVWNILEYNDNIYFVTRNGINTFRNGIMQVFYDSPDVFNKRVNTICFSTAGKLLVGYSGHGFRKIDLKTNLSTWISTEDGLVSNIIHDIEQISDQKFLITTERGIELLTLKDDVAISIIHMANKNSGLGLAKTNPGAVFRDQNHIWVGTQGGVYCYKHHADRNRNAPPIISIQSVDLLNDKLSIDDSRIYEFNYNQNSLGISYFGNCLNDAENVIYQYKLTNFQNEWSLPSLSTNTRFTNLPSGDYRFQVRARNSDGVLSDNFGVFRFKIVPPVWERSWFYFLITLLAVALMRYMYLYRVEANILKVLELEKIREEEATKVRKTMARDFHDNMGNQLASITVFSNLISLKLKDKSEEINGLLNNIEKHSKSLYNGTKDFIWSMNPESDNLLEIFTYLKDFGEDFFNRTAVEFYADNMVGSDQKIEVPSGWSRQIVLIFKEAMTNSLKHSKASSLHLSLQIEHDSFTIVCSDDGKGIEDDKIGKGNGYRNMNTRASQIDCNLNIQSNAKNGLEVILTGFIPKKEEDTGIKIF